MKSKAKGTDTQKKREELKKNIKKICKFCLETYQIQVLKPKNRIPTKKKRKIFKKIE
jgi:hypothetical protein